MVFQKAKPSAARMVCLLKHHQYNQTIVFYFFCVLENEYGASLSAVPRCLLGSADIS